MCPLSHGLPDREDRRALGHPGNHPASRRLEESEREVLICRRRRLREGSCAKSILTSFGPVSVRSGTKTMSAYIFASVEITDPAAYEEYRRRVPAITAAYGGRYLARGGTV